MNYNIILVFISLIVVSNCQIPRWGRCPDATVIQNFDASRVSACSFIVVIFQLRWFRFMVFNATFSNISVISWGQLVETRVHRESQRPVTSHWQTLSHNVVSISFKISVYSLCCTYHRRLVSRTTPLFLTFCQRTLDSQFPACKDKINKIICYLFRKKTFWIGGSYTPPPLSPN